MRGIWASLVAIHGVPLVLVAARFLSQPTWLDAASLLLLLAVTALFAGKAANVRWLRTDRPLIEAVAWLIAGTLAHGDVAVPMVSSAPSLPTVVLVAGGAAAGSKRVRRLAKQGMTAALDSFETIVSLLLGEHQTVAGSPIGRGRCFPGMELQRCFRPIAAGWSARPPPLTS